MCKTPRISTDFVNDIDNSIFEYEFLYSYHTKLTLELLKLIDHNKKTVSNAFSMITFLKVEIILLLHFGASLFLKVFDTLKKFNLIN